MSEDIKFLSKVLSRCLRADKHSAFVFGSRATGTHAKFSDYDVAIEGPRLSSSDYFDLVAELEESDFPYKVDLVYAEDLTDRFLEIAKEKIIPIPLTDFVNPNQPSN